MGSMNATYMRRKHFGLCVRCGTRKAARGAVHCRACLTGRRDAARRRMQAIREAQRLAPGPNRIAGNGTWHVLRVDPDTATPRAEEVHRD
jgi:hypothetical protein